MKFQQKILVVCCLFLELGFAAKLPQTFQRCKVSRELDNKPNECLRGTIENAIVQLSNDGNKDLGVSDLDPLRISEIVIDQGGESPVAVKLKYISNDLFGLKDIKINSVRGKVSSPRGFNMVVDGFLPTLQMVGPYSISGRVLVLPIQGEGRSNLTLVNVQIKVTIVGESQTKNGKEYLKVNSLKYEMKPTKLINEFRNLFNGNRALGDNMNKFINDNWEEVYNELKPWIALGAVFEAYAKRILERVPFKHMFITA